MDVVGSCEVYGARHWTETVNAEEVVFEGDSGRRYASAVKKIVDTCKAGLDEAVEGGDDLKFLRLRTRKHELMISPDERYLLVVLQDPSQ